MKTKRVKRGLMTRSNIMSSTEHGTTRLRSREDKGRREADPVSRVGPGTRDTCLWWAPSKPAPDGDQSPGLAAWLRSSQGQASWQMGLSSSLVGPGSQAPGFPGNTVY